MMLDLSSDERSFLLELLEAKHSALLHEIHHTDTEDFKEMLREQVDLVEELKTRIAQLNQGTAGSQTP